MRIALALIIVLASTAIADARWRPLKRLRSSRAAISGKQQAPQQKVQAIRRGGT